MSVKKVYTYKIYKKKNDLLFFRKIIEVFKYIAIIFSFISFLIAIYLLLLCDPTNYSNDTYEILYDDGSLPIFENIQD